MKHDPDQFTAVLGKYVYRSAYTPGQLASLTAVPKMTIVNWLNGRVKRPRGWQRIAAIATALRLTEAEADELLAAAQQPTIQKLIEQATDEKVREQLAFWQTAVSSQPQPEPPFQAIPLPPYFVGREAERAELVNDLQQERQTAIFCLHGMAGVGKTSLAAQIAYDLQEHFADGVLWARLDSSDTMSILAAFAEAYQRDVSNCLDIASRSGMVRDLLSNRHALVVLDNAQTSEQIEPLLPPTGKCAVLVTTRRQDLAVLVGAKRMAIRPFATDATTSLTLFARILGAERVQAETDLLAHIAAELGHLPLALMIAASRLAYEPGWATAQFGERLGRVNQRLQALRFDKQNVRRSFQISYELLDSTGQQLFASAGRLGRQDFAVTALAALTLQDEEMVADGLRQLFSLSLIQASENGRYALHPLIHDFAQSLTEQEIITERLVAYWTGFLVAHRYTPEAVAREMGHIEVAVQTAVKGKMIRPLRHMLDALMPTLLTRGAHTLAEIYLVQAQTALERAKDVNGQSWVLLRLGQLERERHHLETAESHLQAGLLLARRQNDGVLEAQFLAELGIVYNCSGLYDQGKAFLLQALPLARLVMAEAGDSLLHVLEELGILALMAGDKVAAAGYYEEGLALSQARENDAQTVMFLKSLGALVHLRGEAKVAQSLFEQGMDLAQKLQFHKGMMALANNLGVVAFSMGEMARAEALLQTASKEAERLDDGNAAVLIGLNLAYWARFNGRFAQSRHYFTHVLALVKAQDRVELATKVEAQLAILVEMERNGGERPLSAIDEHLKVFI